jgi:7-carboxy-7-deazaguanine synthase
MLKIIEIFYSIQGESTFAGLPCIFVRLYGCNINCTYCDTIYNESESFALSLEEILKQIKTLPGKLVEITGGEPLLQNEVYSLIEKLTADNYTILLETNGTQSFRNLPSTVHKITDVKCPGSGFPDSFNLDNLNYLNVKQDEIKFVIKDRIDFEFALDFICKHQLEEHTIIFSSVFTELEPKTLAEWILETGKNIRMQLQMHKYIWDPNQKGV